VPVAQQILPKNSGWHLLALLKHGWLRGQSIAIFQPWATVSMDGKVISGKGKDGVI
jgi:hypothetical protein